MITDSDIEAKNPSPDWRKLTPLLIEKIKPNGTRARIPECPLSGVKRM